MRRGYPRWCGYTGASRWGAAGFSCTGKNLFELHCTCSMGLFNIYTVILQQMSFVGKAQKWPGGISVCSIVGSSPSEVTVLHLRFRSSFHRRWAIPATTFLQAINYTKNGKRLHFVGRWIFLAFVPLDLLASLPGNAKGDPGRFPQFFP